MNVLVTGAAGGIGSAVARAFEARGDGVTRHDLRVPSDAGDDYLFGDLADSATLERVRGSVDEGEISCVVAAHGVAGAEALRTVSEARTRFILAVNTISVLRLYDTVAASLAERSGAFVILCSQAGLVGEGSNGVYCASKFALVGWARALDRTTLARPRLRLLCPGATETPLLVEAFQGMADSSGLRYEDVLEARKAQIPAGRLGRVEDLGAAAAWLADLPAPRCLVAAVTGGEVLV